MMSDKHTLQHACKDTCSGWDAGYKSGLEAGARARVVVPSDEEIFEWADGEASCFGCDEADLVRGATHVRDNLKITPPDVTKNAEIVDASPDMSKNPRNCDVSAKHVATGDTSAPEWPDLEETNRFVQMFDWKVFGRSYYIFAYEFSLWLRERMEKK